MQFSTQVLSFLLFCCTAQPASSLSDSWPWSKPAQKLPSWSRRPSQTLPTKNWAPVHPHASELVEQAKQAELKELAGESEQPPAAQADSWPWSKPPASQAEQASEQAPAAQAEQAPEQAPAAQAEQAPEQAPAVQAEQAPEQAPAAQAPAAQAEQAPAAQAEQPPKEELTEGQKAAQRADELAAEQARDAEADKARVQQLQAAVQAKEKAITDLAAKHAVGEALYATRAKRVAKERELKKVADDERAKVHAAEQEAKAAEAAEQVATWSGRTEKALQGLQPGEKKASAAEGERKEQDPLEEVEGDYKVSGLQAQLEAQENELKYQQKKRKMEGELLAKQREVSAATEAQRAKAQAVEAARAVAQAMQLAESQAAEQAQAEVRQRELKVLAKHPGCYMRVPSGCPSQSMKTDKWRKDAWADKHGVDSQGCQGRKATWDAYCGSKDAEMVFAEALEGAN